jgi:pimeloyl-ACP methyl ester carboxylesterase
MYALLIHGAGGGSWEWNVWRRVFAAAGIASTAIDLQPHRDGVAATRWADYVEQVAQAQSALPVPHAVVGASLGGLLALAVASRASVGALVLVNPMPPAPDAFSMVVRPDRPAIVRWRRDASLTGTRRALGDADEAASRYAFRRWRDESGAVLDAARDGLALPTPTCRCVVVASSADEDVPIAVSRALSVRIEAEWLEVAGGHVSPLLGRQAARTARSVAQWLSAR